MRGRYAGSEWLKVAGSTRTKDMQRTSKITFTNTKVLGGRTLVVHGIAKRSKASSKKEMRPLAWRAPVITIGGGEIDFQPLLNSLPGGEDGCLFRGFEVPPGRPRSIVHAIAWSNRPATHAEIMQSARDMLDDQTITGHENRHVLPEVARALGMPTHKREALGYWREQKIVADTQSDQLAMAAAIALARKRRLRSGW